MMVFHRLTMHFGHHFHLFSHSDCTVVSAVMHYNAYGEMVSIMVTAVSTCAYIYASMVYVYNSLYVVHTRQTLAKVRCIRPKVNS